MVDSRALYPPTVLKEARPGMFARVGASLARLRLGFCSATEGDFWLLVLANSDPETAALVFEQGLSGKTEVKR